MAAKQLGELLADGLASEGHYLWKVVADQNAAVGDLWVFFRRAKQQSFVYYIGIDAQQRGNGYGKAAMRALEAAMRPLDVRRIDLNVFGENRTAINLYQGLGYRPVAITMRKEL